MDAFSTYMKISNNVQNTNTSGDFQFEYFENCNKNDSALGSATSLKDTCSVNQINIDNKLCNNLFNNNTKRKILVNIENSPDFNNLIINNKNNNHYINQNINQSENILSNYTNRKNNSNINQSENILSNYNNSKNNSNISLNINENI
jgi:hypothetical protein